MNPTLRFQCSEDWRTMPGDSSVRWCARCGRHIPDFSTLSTDEQRRWLASAERPPCMLMRVNARGEVLSRGGTMPRLTLTVALGVAAVGAAMLPRGPSGTLSEEPPPVEVAPPRSPGVPPRTGPYVVTDAATVELLSGQPADPGPQVLTEAEEAEMREGLMTMGYYN